jgi:hypothetical protein
MREIPILFSTPMVQATLADRKTVTRRTVGLDMINQDPDKWKIYYIGNYYKGQNVFWVMFQHLESRKRVSIKCPYGIKGDKLWFRETWALQKYFNGLTEECFPVYKADFDGPVSWNWKPSIHMPKTAARIWSEVSELRVERLHDITEEEAIKEGIEPLLASGAQLATHGRLYKHYTEHNDGIFGTGLRPIKSYNTLWESINGPESWELNPWVWVESFKVVSKTGRP